MKRKIVFVIFNLWVYGCMVINGQPSYDSARIGFEIQQFKATIKEYNKVIQKRNKTISVSEDWGVLAKGWKRVGNGSILPPIYPETQSLQGGAVMKKDNRWFLLLQAYDGRQHTRLATSENGYKWKHNLKTGNIIVPEKMWEGFYAVANCAIKVNDEYRVYYFGKKSACERIGLTTSKDLIHWVKSKENPIFSALDSRLDGTRVFPDCVIKYQGKFYMYYDIGWDYTHPEHPRSYKIGIAVSDDGINFKDSENSPILESTKENDEQWDSWYVSHAEVIKDGEWFYMLYAGASVKFGKGKRCQSFGLARARHPEGPWEKYPLNPVFLPTGNADLNDGDFDAVYLQHPHLVHAEREWRLYYTGWGYHADAQTKNGGYYAVGMAVTPDR